MWGKAFVERLPLASNSQSLGRFIFPSISHFPVTSAPNDDDIQRAPIPRQKSRLSVPNVLSDQQRFLFSHNFSSSSTGGDSASLHSSNLSLSFLTPSNPSPSTSSPATSSLHPISPTRISPTPSFASLSSISEAYAPTPLSHGSVSRRLSQSHIASHPSHFFQNVRCLGTGGFGAVFATTSLLDGATYAIKRVPLSKSRSGEPDPLAEIRCLAEIGPHEHIVPYCAAWVEPAETSAAAHWDTEEWDEDDSFSQNSRDDLQRRGSSFCSNDASGVSYGASLASEESAGSSVSTVSSSAPPDSYLLIQMRVCQGQNLRTMRLETFKQGGVAAMTGAIAQALAHVHLHGWVHGDVTPKNIVLTPDAGAVTLVDFGLAHRISEDFQSNLARQESSGLWEEADESEVESSPGQGERGDEGVSLYTAPEGPVTPASDVFSLGMVLLETAVPFETEMERVMVMSKVKAGVLSPGELLDESTLPQSLREVLVQMLAMNPSERPSANSVASAFLESDINQL